MLPLYSMTLFILIICFPLPSTELLLFIYTIFIASKQTAVMNPSCLEFCPVLILESEKYSPLCSQSLTNGNRIEWAQQSNVCCCCCCRQYHLFFLSILYICFVSLMGTAKLMMFTSWNCSSKSWISLLPQKAGMMEQVFVTMCMYHP